MSETPQSAPLIVRLAQALGERINEANRAGNAHRCTYLELALVALRAIREPTTAMVDAVKDQEIYHAHEYAEAWRDMIDAALRENPDE